MKKVVFFFSLAILGLIPIVGIISPPNNPPSPVFAQPITNWTIEPLLNGIDTAMATDANGNPHISATDSGGNIIYIYKNGGTWYTQTIGQGNGSAIAIDNNNYAHIVYVASNGDEVKYAHWTGANWQIQTIGTDGGIIPLLSIVLDSFGNPHVSYSTSGTGLIYTYWTGSVWQSQTVDAGIFPSLALDSNNTPHISYSIYLGAFKYAKWTGSGWDIQTVDPNPGHGFQVFIMAADGINISSIVVDDVNAPHISYVKYGTAFSVMYAEKVGANWNLQIVDPIGQGMSIGIDSLQNLHIAYANGGLAKHAFQVGSTWTLEMLDAAASTDHASLSIDSLNNNLHVSYTSPADLLTYAFGNQGFSTPTPTSTTSPTLTPTPSITVSPTPTKTPTTTPSPTLTKTATPSPSPTLTPNTSILPPRELRALAGLDNVLLTWNPSLSGGVAGYHLYRQNNGEAFVRLTGSPLAGLSYRDIAITAGQTYIYYATAVDSSGQESLPSNVVQAVPGLLNLTIPAVHSAPAEIAQVPVHIENADGLCIAAMDLGIYYDPQVAHPISVTRTALTAGYAFEHTIRTPGEAHIATIGNCIPLVGPGDLFLVDFQVYLTATVNSSLDFVRGLTGTVLYDVDDLYNPVPLNLVDGDLILDGQYVRGDLNGDGVVNAADAALALLIASGQLTPTPLQLLAGDVNGDGIINSADASMILYYAAHQEWPPLPDSLFAYTPEANVQFYPGLVFGTPGTEIEVPLLISDGANFAGGTAFLQYGSALAFLSVRLDASLNPNDYQLATYQPQTNALQISLASKTELTSGDHTLIWLRFQVATTTVETQTWVTVTGAWLNDLAGRDFVLSALQRTVTGGTGGILFLQKIFLPVMIR